MLGWLGERLQFTRRLGFRLGILLSLAILPVGLISLVQTLGLSREAERSAELVLLGRTSTAAAGERALLQSALGTADALGPAVLETQGSGSMRNCMDLMTNFIERSSIYIFAGFFDMDGMSNCNSSGDPQNIANSPDMQRFMTWPGTHIFAATHGLISGQSVVIVAQPVFSEASLIGYVAVSISHDLLRSTHSTVVVQSDDKLLTFSANGEVLSYYTSGRNKPESLLPADISLRQLAQGQETTFHARSTDGQDRIFAVVPIIPGLAYAMGSYTPTDSGIAGFKLANISAVLFTMSLLAVSLTVAYFAVYHLVLRHIRELRGQMRRFAIGDRSQLPRVIREAPAELVDVSQTFHNMARILIRDEERLENAVAEKTILLKEVHHRVKNNLQLIASIINMQNRLLSDPDAKWVLRSVQDRVASLATIYRKLYQAEHLDAVEAGRLIEDIINQMSVASDRPSEQRSIQTDLTPITLLPDQAVPLSLLATEAFTNALKYSGIPEGEDVAWLRVALYLDGANNGVLEISNSLGPGNAEQRRSDSTGLGGQLIEAFAMQLDGEAEIVEDAVSYILRVRFRIEAVLDDLEDSRAVLLTSAPRPGAQH